MSYAIDVSTYGRELKVLYDSIVANEDTQWAVFGYSGKSLKPVESGSDGLESFVEEFDDGKIQYGFARVDYNAITKFVLVGWVGEGVPEQQKGYFNAHFATVARLFPVYHVQLTARNSGDLTVAAILKKVDESSGSKYSASGKSLPTKPKYVAPVADGADDSEWGDTPAPASQITPVTSSYKPTKVEVHKAKPEKPAALQSSYQPVGKIDIAALRAQGKGSKFADDKLTPLQPAYQPVGKVDIKAIRAQAANAKKPSEISSTPQPSESTTEKTSYKASYQKPAAAKAAVDNDDDEEDNAPKSLKDRMSVFSGGSGRLNELPKPKVENKVASRFSAAATGRGTAPSLPSDGLPKTSNVISPFPNYSASGGKTPAQLWAEKNAKKAPSESSGSSELTPASSGADTNNSVDNEPEPSVADARAIFSGSAAAEPVTPKVEKQPDAPSKSSFADITSKFAAAKVAELSPPPAPAAAPEPIAEPVAESEDEQPEIQLPRAVPAPPTDDFSSPPAPTLPARDTSAPALPSRETAEPAPPSLPTREPVTEAPAKGPSAIAAYDYTKDEDNELDLVEGELIVDIEFLDEDWWRGTNSKGEVGMFPASYVELQDSEDSSVPAAPGAAPANAPAASGPSAMAEFDYDAQDDNELTFPEGAKITDIEFVDEDWWSGVYNGERNLFPASYVTLIDE